MTRIRPRIRLRVRPIKPSWVLVCFVFSGLGANTAWAERVSTTESVDLSYAQSSDAWATVDKVKSAQGDLDQINQVLHDNYGSYEEAFAHAAVGISGLTTGLDFPLLRRLYFDTSSDALAFGRVQNPVVPELKADALLSGEIASGFDGSIEGSDVGQELRTRVGGHFGMGYEKRVDAVSTDLIENIPTEGGSLSYYGFDLRLQKDFAMIAGLAIHSSAAVSDTAFHSSIDAATVSTVRWKLKNDLSGTSLALETVVGPQPLPVDFLPRTWDYVDQLNPWPELGAMTGAGLAWRSRLSDAWIRNTSLLARGGFYGGYPGGEIGLEAGDFKASIETWGIEASSAYQTLGQRLYLATAGVSL